MITIIDYQAGNLTSVKRALDALGIPGQISADPQQVRRAERIIFPGVGAAGAAMAVLRARGLGEALTEAFRAGTPILGICLGCQIILTHSEEDDADCLNLIPGQTVRFRPADPALKIPHMGWNEVAVVRSHPLLAHLRPGDQFYFVHSYYPQPERPEDVFAVCGYGFAFPAAIGRDNLFAVQFHAEKSGPVGLQILRNFAEWKV
ncbi:MAG: imidazole glycerol phosphate synthase subunit HisH [Anaerolineae bacterium]|nr:imidazole glycerol phosphate synthase subunit HisH [Anaerolineae bacterium]